MGGQIPEGFLWIWLWDSEGWEWDGFFNVSQLEWWKLVVWVCYMGSQEVVQGVSKGIGKYLDSPLFVDVVFHHGGPGGVVLFGNIM